MIIGAETLHASHRSRSTVGHPNPTFCVMPSSYVWARSASPTASAAVPRASPPPSCFFPFFEIYYSSNGRQQHSEETPSERSLGRESTLCTSLDQPSYLREFSRRPGFGFGLLRQKLVSTFFVEAEARSTLVHIGCPALMHL